MNNTIYTAIQELPRQMKAFTKRTYKRGSMYVGMFTTLERMLTCVTRPNRSIATTTNPVPVLCPTPSAKDWTSTRNMWSGNSVPRTTRYRNDITYWV